MSTDETPRPVISNSQRKEIDRLVRSGVSHARDEAKTSVDKIMEGRV